MRPVHFNHARGARPGMATSLLGIGLLMLLLLLVSVYVHINTGNHQLRQHMAARRLALQPVLPGRAMRETPQQQAEAKAVALALVHIQTPWLPLLASLEAAQTAPVYWTSLAPDAKRQRIRMTVLTGQRGDGWTFLKRLKQQSTLRDVKLNANTATEVSGIRLSVFDLEAAWVF